jgi:hypothetical protein
MPFALLPEKSVEGQEDSCPFASPNRRTSRPEVGGRGLRCADLEGSPPDDTSEERGVAHSHDEDSSSRRAVSVMGRGGPRAGCSRSSASTARDSLRRSCDRARCGRRTASSSRSNLKAPRLGNRHAAIPPPGPLAGGRQAGSLPRPPPYLRNPKYSKRYACKGCAEALGHSTIVETMNRYSHVLSTMQADAAERLDALF